MRKIGFSFLLLGILSDFLTPYGLGLFYPQLNQFQRVMSVFGDVDSPVRNAFLVWSVISGIFFVGSLPAVYQTFVKTSKKLAGLLTAAIGAYGIGDCIFTGLFSINTEQAAWTFSTWIHNLGSGIGYAGFLLAPLLLYLLYKKQGAIKLSRRYLILWGISLVFAGVYALARIPVLQQFIFFQQLGLFQRISFFFNYLPLAIFAITQLRTGEKKQLDSLS